MKITKEFWIDELSLRARSNIPYLLELSNVDDSPANIDPSELRFDEEILKQWGIADYLDLVGKKLRCTFESWELGLIDEGHHKDSIDWSSVGSQDLSIGGVKREDETTFMRYAIPPMTFNRVLHLLRLQSFGGGDGIHPSPLPCPFYTFNVKLTEDEYDECALLTPTSVMKVSFEVVAQTDE